MTFESINMDRMECQALFGYPTGARMNITSKQVTVTRVVDGRKDDVAAGVTFNATATDVFMKIDGVPHRLFVDIDVDLPSGLKHIWLTDGPAVVRHPKAA